jgi:MATE family multidrug resistance protein
MIILCELLLDPNPKATVAAMGTLIQNTSLLYISPSSLILGVSMRVGNDLRANRPQRLG